MESVVIDWSSTASGERPPLWRAQHTSTSRQVRVGSVVAVAAARDANEPLVSLPDSSSRMDKNIRKSGYKIWWVRKVYYDFKRFKSTHMAQQIYRQACIDFHGLNDNQASTKPQGVPVEPSAPMQTVTLCFDEIVRLKSSLMVMGQCLTRCGNVPSFFIWPTITNAMPSIECIYSIIVAARDLLQ
jgi:hypothetical protein